MDYTLKNIAIDFFEYIGYTISKNAEFQLLGNPQGSSLFISENVNYYNSNKFCVTKSAEYFTALKIEFYFHHGLSLKKTLIKTLSMQEVLDMIHDLQEMKKNIKTIFVPSKTS